MSTWFTLLLSVFLFSACGGGDEAAGAGAGGALGSSGEGTPAAGDDTAASSGGDDTSEPSGGDDTAGPVDADGDGYTEGGDCDDADASVHPGADDTCGDGVDQYCDGEDPACDPALHDLGSDALAVRGAAAGDMLGEVVFTSADLDGDGARDLFVTASPNAPVACYGLEVDGMGRAGTIDADSVASFRVFQSTDRPAGSQWVDAVTDVDGDGYADLLTVGCGSQEDAVCVGLGPFAGDVAWEDAPFLYVLYDPDDGNGSNFTSSAAGDFDGDGAADLVLIDATWGIRAGRAWVAYGPVTADRIIVDEPSVYPDGSDGWLCWPAASVGDVDGDGADEFALASTERSVGAFADGAVFVFLDPVLEDLLATDADIVVYGSHSMEYLGTPFGVGDLDGDGRAELAIGATESDSSGIDRAGAVYVFSSRVSGWVSASAADGVLLGTEDGETAGTSVARDGFVDLLVGAPQMRYKDTKPGRAYLVLGPFSGRRSLGAAGAVFEGVTGVGKETGSSVAGDVDLDGDGELDAVIGSWLASTDGLTACGTAYVVFGPLLQPPASRHRRRRRRASDHDLAPNVVSAGGGPGRAAGASTA